MDALVGDIFGYNALQLGLPELNALQENRMPFHCLVLEHADETCLEEMVGLERLSQWPTEVLNHETNERGEVRVAAQAKINPRRQLVASFHELPVASQSIDLVVLPHVLEFAADPHEVLREVERVLRPEGQVIISGFNPYSLWGARQRSGALMRALNGGVGRAEDQYLPGAEELLGVRRLKDWLKLLGFEVSRGRFGCYRPPFKTSKWLNRWEFMEKAGDRWWPIFGSAYTIAAIKRVKGMRLIGPAWKKRASVTRLSPAAQRVQKQHSRQV